MTQKSEPWEILPLAPAHISQIAAIEQACFTDPWSLETLTEELTAPLARYFVCQGETGTVLGYIGTRMVYDVCEITNVAVIPARRRQGLAGAMYRALEAECRRRGITLVNLEVRETNLTAQAFYRAYGFVPVGKRRNYYESPREDAILMSRLLEKEETSHEHFGD